MISKRDDEILELKQKIGKTPTNRKLVMDAMTLLDNNNIFTRKELMAIEVRFGKMCDKGSI